MIDNTPPRSRPRTGGRSARIREAVLDATLAVLSKAGLHGLTIAAVAERSGVHATSIYRRWQTPDALALDAALHTANNRLPVPDCGNLRDDLVFFLSALAAYIQTPLGKALLAVLASQGNEALATIDRFWTARLAQAAVMAERAKARGEIESGADASQLVRMAIAPLYFEVLLHRRPVSAKDIADIAETTRRAFAPRA